MKRKQIPHIVAANYVVEETPKEFYPFKVKTSSVGTIPTMTSEDINVDLYGVPEGKDKQRSYHKEKYHYIKQTNPGRLRQHRDKMRKLYQDTRDQRHHEYIRLRIERERREREQRLAAGYSGDIPECSTSSKSRSGKSQCDEQSHTRTIEPPSRSCSNRPGTSRGRSPIEVDEND